MTDYFLSDANPQKPYSIEYFEQIVSEIHVGDYIKFKTSDGDVSGIVEEKYPFIFKLSNGVYYQWVDYLLGGNHREHIRRFS